MKSKYPSSVKRGDKGLASRKPILTYVCTQGVVIQLGEDNSGGKEEEIGRERWEAPQVEGPHQNIGAQVSTNFLLAVGSGVLRTARDTQGLEGPLSYGVEDSCPQPRLTWVWMGPPLSDTSQPLTTRSRLY